MSRALLQLSQGNTATIEYFEGRIKDLEESIKGQDPRYFGADKIVEKIEFLKEEVEILKNQI